METKIWRKENLREKRRRAKEEEEPKAQEGFKALAKVRGDCSNYNVLCILRMIEWSKILGIPI